MSKITESASQELCTVRIPNHCNRDNTTTVLAHKNGAGWAAKASDIHGAYACSNCHDIIDGRVPNPQEFTEYEILLMFYEGIFRTQLLLIEKELIAF